MAALIGRMEHIARLEYHVAESKEGRFAQLTKRVYWPWALPEAGQEIDGLSDIPVFVERIYYDFTDEGERVIKLHDEDISIFDGTEDFNSYIKDLLDSHGWEGEIREPLKFL